MARIMLLAPASSIHSCRWAHGLESVGHTVNLVSHHPLLEAFNGPEKFEYTRLPVVGKKGYFLNRSALKKIIQEWRPDILHAHFASGYGTLATLSNFKPRIVSVWGSDVYEFVDKSPLHHRLIRKVLRSATAVASTSETMGRRTSKISGLTSISVTPFGVDTDLFHPEFKREGPWILGTVKTLAPKYGIDLLLRSFHELIMRAPDKNILLKIGGIGPDLKALRDLAHTLGIERKVEFLGAIPHSQVPHVLQSFDVFASLSRAESESFGVSVIEAGACGLPVIVSDAGGLPEVVKDGFTGWIVKKGSTTGLAQIVLSKDLFNRDRCQAIGKAARQHVENRYSWKKSLQTMNELYESVLNRI
jgi:L-malate glycosyltransferase